MTAWALYAATSGLVMCTGLWALLTSEHILRRIIGVNLFGAGVFLLLVAIAARAPGPIADPVPHAMVLTGLVVAVSTTAVALALAVRARESERQRTADAPEGVANEEP